MKNSQVSVTLEHVRNTQNVQHHTGGAGGSYTTEVQQLPSRYEVVKVRGAISVDVGSKVFRVGDSMTEAEAVNLAGQSFYDMTVTK